MITISLRGGLGNQLFQVAGTWFLRSRGLDAVCDASFYARPAIGHTPRSLEVQEILSPRELRRLPGQVARLAYSDRNPWYVRESSPDDDVLRTLGNSRAWVEGYFQDATYPLAVRAELRQRLLPYLARICDPTDVADVVSVHVRLGDYFADAATRDYHGVTAPSYFADATQRVRQETGTRRVRVFTDSPKLLALHYPEILDSQVEVAATSSAWETLAEMARCRGMVMSNSSLSWWAAFVATALVETEPYVVLPTPWFAQRSALDEKLVVAGWTRMDRALLTADRPKDEPRRSRVPAAPTPRHAAASLRPGHRRLTHDVVVCTRNRPDDLAVALKSLSMQSRAPDGVIVVDASDDDDSGRVLADWQGSLPAGFTRVERITAPPGLPRQRNIGVQASSADVVHFIDDDVILDEDYIAALSAVFEEDGAEDVVGAGGLIRHDDVRRPRLWWRLARMDSKRAGAVLRSGIGIIVTDADDRQRVQWLSGCSMSYRRETVLRLRFDEFLQGYALMEDVDFGLRASRAGTLILEPHARLVHNVSPVERWDHQSRQRAATYRRGWFVAKNFGWRGLPFFWWSVLAGAAVQLGTAVAKRSRFGVKVALWQLQGAVDFLRGRR